MSERTVPIACPILTPVSAYAISKVGDCGSKDRYMRSVCTERGVASFKKEGIF